MNFKIKNIVTNNNLSNLISNYPKLRYYYWKDNRYFEIGNLTKLYNSDLRYIFLSIRALGFIVLKDVLVLNDGFISKNIGFTIEGNCNHDAFYGYNFRNSRDNFRTINKGIALTTSYSAAVFHSIIEGLTKFMPFYNNNLFQKDLQIILPYSSKRTFPAYQILKYILNSDENIKVVPVIVKNLIIPLPGTCGYGIHSNIVKINKILIRKLSNDTLLNGNKLLIIKRNGNRKFKNYNETKELITSFFRNYEILVYDDNTLYQYKEILRMFYESSIIIGVHGAGFSNIIACRSNTTILEINTPRNNRCFEGLSKQLSLLFKRYIFNKTITGTYKVAEVFINISDFSEYLKNNF